MELKIIGTPEEISQFIELTKKSDITAMVSDMSNEFGSEPKNLKDY